MHETLFNPAFWMPLAVVIVGVGVFLYGNARVKGAIRNAGVGVVLLAVTWYAVAHFVDTFSEKCVKRTDAVIAAVESGKWDDLRSLLDNNTQLAMFRGPEIATVAETAAGTYQLREIRILLREVASTPNGVDVTIDTLNEGQQNSTSTWTFTYEQRSDGILLRKITPIRLNGRPMEEIERAMGRFR